MMIHLAIVLVASVLAAEPTPSELTGSCDLAHYLYAQGDYSRAISKLNQCMSEEELSPEQKACAVLNRAQSYFTMGQLDKSQGDLGSALASDPNLNDLDIAAACLAGSPEDAAQLLEQASEKP